uniref:Uncharacterized protein n=1 Tax=Nelumbo nucifera TaxID=4432 RepID=A0A822ZSV8_NELNU|nr:TPA_asm: hypothetical protein HUJ06_003178 [Nelumbo nucifera]
MGPLFPRLHVNDTEKGGPRAPSRNKMTLYGQLSIPSQMTIIDWCRRCLFSSQVSLVVFWCSVASLSSLFTGIIALVFIILLPLMSPFD